MPLFPRHARTRVAAAACWLLFALLGVAIAAVPFAPTQLRWLDYHAVPAAPATAALVAYFVVAIAARTCPRRGLVNCALVLLLLVAHLSVCTQPLGDANTWREWARADRAGASELLANALHRVVYRVWGHAGLDYVAPFVGALFGWVFLAFAERALVAGARRRAGEVRLLAAAALALSGWQLLCCRGFVENTLLSLPFLVLGLGALMRATTARAAERALAAATAWLTLAASCHGVQTAMWPVLVAIVLWRRWRRGASAGVVRPLLVVAGTCAVTLAAVLGALAAAGFTIQEGHVAGGGDHRHFVPLQIAGSAYQYDFAMFDVAHVADVGNIFLFTSALALATLLAGTSNRWRSAALAEVRRQPVLAIAGLGAASFTALYYFDLRFPYDVDLMVVMSATVGLFLLQVAARAPRRLWAWLRLAVLANGVLVWTLAASLLVTPEAADPAAPVLRLNGRTGDVALRRGEHVWLSVVPPPGGQPPFTFSVFARRGEPQVVDAAAHGNRQGLAFAPPGSPDADAMRTLVVLDATVVGVAGYLAPAIHESWLSAPLGNASGLGPLTVQAQLRDRRGEVTTTPAVRLLPR